MRIFALALTGLLAISFSAISADGKEDEKKLDKKEMKANVKLAVGEWVVMKGESLNLGTVMVLTKDGKLKITDPDKSAFEGTYKYDGGKTMEVKLNDNVPEKIEIKKLTDKEMIMFDSAKKTDVFKRKEPKKA